MGKTMGTTTITKKYVQDRIGARIATLERVIQDGRNAEDELMQRKIKPMKEWYSKTSVAVVSAYDWLAGVDVSTIKDGDLPRYIQQLNSLLPSGWQDSSRWNYDAAAGALKERIEAGTRAGVEKIKLQHAQAYLQEMPADEFSLTGLKSLGLMEAIKFRLEPEAKK
jgi:hypothetical protein